MGQELNVKTKLVVKYYLFQKKIENYLKYPEDKNDEYIIHKGFLIHPDWIEKFRNAIKYEGLIFHLDHTFFKKGLEDNQVNTTLAISKDAISKEQVQLLSQFVQPKLETIDINSIILEGAYDYFKLKDNNLLSLENLKGFIDYKTYEYLKDINKNVKEKIKIKTIKYIFKQGMIFFLNDNDINNNEINNIIKLIILDKENKNKLINLKFNFNYTNKYKEYLNLFEKKNSEEITKYLNSIEILKKNYYEHNDMNKILFTVSNESKIEKENNKNFNNKGRKQTFSHIYNIKEKLNYQNLNEKDNDKEEKQIKKAITISEKDLNLLVDNRKLKTLTFVGEGNKIIMSMTCKSNVPFKKYEEQLFKKFPDYRNTDVTFLVNGRTIDRKTSLDENNINDNDTILIIKY